MKKTNLVLGMMLIILLALSTSLMAVDYYVDPTGTDDGSHGEGTGTDAWATIEYAVNTVADPTTAAIIHVSGDTYTLGSNEIYINRGFTDLTIRGAGAGSTIVQAAVSSGTATDRIFYIMGSDETVTLEDMTIRYGKTDDGGGLFNDSGTLTMTNCTVSGNTATSRGGGLFNDSGTLTMTNCTVRRNTASSHGGGLYSQYETVTMTNCTISGNTADGASGGGGLFIFTGPVTITNCTFANNSAPNGPGGGIRIYAGSLYIKNTIIANNSASGTVDFHNGGGTLTNNGYNIVETQNGSDFTDGDNGCIVGEGTYNLSTTLEENNTTNGTYTLKTTSGSAAINAGNAATSADGKNVPPTTDQRGANRNGATDIGAYEYWSDEGALPVELASFTAENHSGSVLLKWCTESETENLGFIIEKLIIENGQLRIKDEEWESVANYLSDRSLKGNGTTTESHSYYFVDATVQSGVTYTYRLGDVDYNSNITWHNKVKVEVEAEEEKIPAQFGLLNAYPNPFNPEITLRYGLTEDAHTTLFIYDMRGQLVETLQSGNISAGNHSIIWQPMNISTGVYIVRLRSGNSTNMQKIVYVK